MPDGKVLSGIFGFNAFEQFLRTDAIQPCQGQQVGGAGFRGTGLPFAHRLAADAQPFGHKFLGHMAADTVLF